MSSKPQITQSDVEMQPTGTKTNGHAVEVPAATAGGGSGTPRHPDGDETHTDGPPQTSSLTDIEQAVSEGSGDDEPSDVANADKASDTTNHSFFTREALAVLPQNTHKAYFSIKNMDEDDRAALFEATQHIANACFSTLQYTGTAWYLPKIYLVEEWDDQWAARFEAGVLFMTLNGRCMEINVLGYLIRACILVLFWFALWAAIGPKLVELRGYVFDPILLVIVSALIGGIICRFLQIPPLIGVLWVAMMWNNIPTPYYLTGGIVKDVKKVVAGVGVTFILLRAGCSIKLESLKKMALNVLLISTMPLAFECIVHSFVANAAFGYNNYTWSFLQGMIMASTSPSVIVPGALFIQSRGFGKKDPGPLPLLLTSCGIDPALVIWGANFINGLVFDADKDLGLQIALGPIQMIVGVLIGAVLGGIGLGICELLFREAKKLKSGRYAPSHLNSVSMYAFWYLVLSGVGTYFFASKYSLAGGASLSIITEAFVFVNGLMHHHTIHHDAVKNGVYTLLADFWDLLIMPAIFSMAGAQIVLAEVFNATFFPPAIACIAAGLATRALVAFCCTVGMALTMPQRALAMLMWCGKATVQVSLMSLVYNRAGPLHDAHPDDHHYHELYLFSLNVQRMAALMAAICAPLGSLAVVLLGPRVLSKDFDEEANAREVRVAQSPRPESMGTSLNPDPAAAAATAPEDANGGGASREPTAA